MRLGKLLTYFLPFIASSLLRLVAIPVTTYVLGPTEYGLFALMMGVVSICTVLATSVTGYIVSHRAHPGKIAPRGLIVTVALLETGVGLILAAFCMVGWPLFARWMGIAGDISPLAFLALLISVPLGAFWTSASIVIVFDERAGLYSATVVAQGVVQLATTIFALYVLDWRVGSLVAGQLMGVATCAVGGYLGLRRHFSIYFDREVAREAFALMPWSMVSGFANSMTDLLERVILGRVTSTRELGLYVHAQSYRSMFGTAGKAFVQVLQPTMMNEARSGSFDFSGTRDGWNVVYAMFTLLGLCFALIGREVVGFLTHGKFVDAAIYIPFWCVFLTFQYLGRAQVAMLYTQGQGKRISLALFLSNIVSGSLMLLLGVPYHAFGLVAAVLIGELVNRALLQYWTSRLWALPFQDWFALMGAALIVVVTVIVDSFSISLAMRVVLLVLACSGAAIAVGPAARRFLMQPAR